MSEIVARLEAKVANLAGLIQKVGLEAAREYSLKMLLKACDDFLCDDPLKAQEHEKTIVALLT